MVRAHLKAFLEHLRLNENASAHTVRAYDSDLSQFLAFLAARLDRRVSDLAPADLDHLNARAFLADLNKRGNSKASAARKLSAIRAFGRYLRHEEVLDSDPAALVGTPKREVRIPNHLAVDEMSKLLDAPDTSVPLGRRDKAILELFYASGLRLSELVGLDVDDVNLSARVVRVLGKGRKERIVPFNPTGRRRHARLAARPRGAARRVASRAPGLTESDHGVTTQRCRGFRDLTARDAAREPLFLNYREDGCRPAASTRSSPLRPRVRARATASARTRYATPSPRICSKRAPICAPFRSCSATPDLSTTQRYTHVNAAQLIETYRKAHPKA